MRRIYIATLAVAALALLAWSFAPRTAPAPAAADPDAPEMTFGEREHDFGVLLQSGGPVSYRFPYEYRGSIDRTVIGVPGSCGCTTAEIDRDVLHPGDTGYVTVTFDPNLHEEPEGKFYKTATVLAEPPLTKEAEVRIWAQIDLDLGPEAYKLGEDDDDDDDEDEEAAVHMLSAEELGEWLAQKEKGEEIFLLDTHIPEQEHIASTDAFIPFNEIAQRAGELPQDKDARIVVYCRSGSMSAEAAKDLVLMGYTDVWDLQGGKNAFDAR